MAVRIQCPNPGCRKTVEVAEEHLGRSVRCAGCRQPFKVPATPADMGPATASKPGIREETGAATDNGGRSAPVTTSPERSATVGNWPAQIGRFQVRARLGAGAFGTVYRAFDPQLEREVALKVPQAGTLENAKAVERFLREAKAAARLRHPHIVPVHDAGHDGQRYYIASAFIHGEPLANAIGDKGVEFRRAAGIVSELAGALAYAHHKGIVHRDVKPANVMLDAEGEAHLMDFGLAHFQDSTEKLTHAGATLGTPSYMAPEQAAGQSDAATPAADQYSLGVVLYELLCGQTPFSGPANLQIFHHVNTEPPSPRTANPAVPLDLETICLKALTKRPEDRYPTCQALADDLRRWLDGEPIQARRLKTMERLTRWCRRNPGLAGALSAAAVLLVLAASLGVSFAVYQTHAANQLTSAAADLTAKQTETENALAEAQRQRDEARHQTDRAIRQLCDNYLLRALTLVEQGEPGTGLLRLAEALDLAERHHFPDFDHLLRANLAQCAQHASSLEGIFQHNAAVMSVAVSADGKLVATGTNAQAQVFEAETGRPISPPLPHPLKVTALAFGPDKRILLSGSADKQARFWEVATGKSVGSPVQHAGPVVVAAISPDGRTAATGADSDKALRLFKVPTGELVGAPLPHQADVCGVAFSPDGKQLWTGDRAGSLYVWHAATGERIGQPTPSVGGGAKFMAFQRDGETVLAGTDNRGQLRKRATGENLGPPLPHQYLTCLAISPDGKILLTGSLDHEVRMWRTGTDQSVAPPILHQSGIAAMAFLPDGRQLVTASLDFTAKLWRLAPAASHGFRLTQPGNTHAAFSPDGRTLATCGSVNAADARLWDTGTGYMRHPPLPHPRDVNRVAFSPDGRTLATACDDSFVRRWDVATGQPIGQPLPNGGAVRALAYSPDGKLLLAGGLRATVSLWDAVTGQALAPFSPKMKDNVYAAVFSPDSKRVLFGTHGFSALLWDVASREFIDLPIQHESHVVAVAFSPDGKRILTGSTDNTVRQWDAATGRLLCPPLMHHGHNWSVAFSPDGAVILSQSLDRTARLWDAATGKPIGPPLRGSGEENVAAFSPDGRWFVIANGGVVEFWPLLRPMPGEPVKIKRWAEAATGMAINPEGTVYRLSQAEWQERHQALLGDKREAD